MHYDDVRKQVTGLHSTFDVQAMAQSDRAAAPPRKNPSIAVNVVLFICTVATTILAGALQQGVNPLQEPTQIPKGLPFSAALLFILVAHEMGHFLTSKYYRIDASLPYFIPAPTFIGTFGAFIKMRSPVLNKRVLLDVGANGPLAGLVVATKCPTDSPVGASKSDAQLLSVRHVTTPKVTLKYCHVASDPSAARYRYTRPL